MKSKPRYRYDHSEGTWRPRALYEGFPKVLFTAHTIGRVRRAWAIPLGTRRYEPLLFPLGRAIGP